MWHIYSAFYPVPVLTLHMAVVVCCGQSFLERTHWLLQGSLGLQMSTLHKDLCYWESKPTYPTSAQNRHRIHRHQECRYSSFQVDFGRWLFSMWTRTVHGVTHPPCWGWDFKGHSPLPSTLQKEWTSELKGLPLYIILQLESLSCRRFWWLGSPWWKAFTTR